MTKNMYPQLDINDLVEDDIDHEETFYKGRGPDKAPRKSRGTKQPHDESFKDTPEYDVKQSSAKVTKIRSQLDQLKAEYKAKFGKDYEPS